MHIGLIIYSSLETISGGYLYDRQLVRYLQSQGDEVQIFSLPWTNYGNHLLHNVSFKIQNELQAASFDLLLQDELNHPSLFWLNRGLKQQINRPIVSIVHHLRSSESHPALLMPLYRWVEGQYLRTVDGFIFNSKTTRAAVTALSGEEKPHVIAYPAADHSRGIVDRESVKERAHDAGPLRLIFVGNIIPRKGCHILLKALASLPKESWQLAMVGDLSIDPQYARQVKGQAYASGIDANIQWYGRLSDSDLAELLSTSQLLVVPSTYEGFGIVYLEGMNYGLPAVATTSGAAHETISDGENGYLIPAGDAQSLAAVILRLNRDRQLLSGLSLAALDQAQSRPTWEMSMARIRQFLVEMVS